MYSMTGDKHAIRQGLHKKEVYWGRERDLTPQRNGRKRPRVGGACLLKTFAASYRGRVLPATRAGVITLPLPGPQVARPDLHLPGC